MENSQLEIEHTGSSAPQHRLLWLRMLAGPLIYSAYFLAVYLVVEAACNTGWISFSFAGTNGVTVVVVVLTAVALAAVLVSLALQVRRLRRLPAQDEKEGAGPECFAARVGFLLDLLSVLLVLATGAPALLLAPCVWS
jgi:hypothetical protein